MATACPAPLKALAEFRDRLAALPGPCTRSARAARERQGQLTKPPGSLGRLEELAAWLAAWQGRHPPRLERIRIAVFAGNHGVVRRGVSAYPAAVTEQMVRNFEAGGAAINQLARAFGAELRVYALELHSPTEDFVDAPAMSPEACLAALNAGLAAVEEGLDLLCVGEMGIGNTTAAAAVAAALLGGPPQRFAGPGTGLDPEGVRRKAMVIEAALDRHRHALDDPLEVLRRLGGRELAAMAGAVLGARLVRVPVLLDGFVCAAAALVLQRLCGDALAHAQAGHRSAEPAHRLILEELRLQPLLDLGMRLGEASGAATAIGILKAAVACHNGMATFEDAGVSRSHGEAGFGED